MIDNLLNDDFLNKLVSLGWKRVGNSAYFPNIKDRFIIDMIFLEDGTLETPVFDGLLYTDYDKSRSKDMLLIIEKL